jgi:hypothetical protein
MADQNPKIEDLNRESQNLEPEAAEDAEGGIIAVLKPAEAQVGVFDPATGNWYLRNSNSPGTP